MLAQFLRHLFDDWELVLFDYDTRAVGNLHDSVERRHGACGIDQGLRAKCFTDSVTRPAYPFRIAVQNGFDELREERGMGHAAFNRIIDDGVDVDVLPFMFAARTEQRRMTGSSIIATVDCSRLGRNEFQLNMGDGAVLAIKIANRVLRKIESDIEVEKAHHRFRNQA